MKPPRGLSDDEQAAWARLAQSVTPMGGRRRPVAPATAPAKAQASEKRAPNVKPPRASPSKSVGAKGVSTPTPAHRRKLSNQLDSHWNRRLKSGQVAPDYTLDLHGHTLDAAYDRIMSGLDQARAMGARLVLVVAGRERPIDPADRGSRRGAIRAKLLDWLAASHHGDAIAAVRKAHIRHGGEGALYLVLRRGG